MDISTYALEVIARDRLTEMRARGERSRRARAARPVSRPLLVTLGQALIRWGRRWQGIRDYSISTIDAGRVGEARGGPSHGAGRG
jgi:hypothetical protein